MSGDSLYSVFEHEWEEDTPSDYVIEFGGYVNVISFIYAPVNCSVKLDTVSNDSIPDIESGTGISGIPTNRIFITSTTKDTKVVILVTWIDV